MGFTDFIQVHVNGEPMIINISRIAYVSDNFICVAPSSDGEDKGFECEESFADINNMIAEALSHA